jgi:hypothetical protein
MSATLESLVSLTDPSSAAGEIARLNSLLAGSREVPAEVWDFVTQMTSRLGNLDVQRWQTIDPYLHSIFLRGFAQASEALGKRDTVAGRRLLRVGLERMRHALEEIAEVSRMGDQQPKELVRWLEKTIDVPQRELASVLGVDLRKLQRWLHDSPKPEGDDALRVQVVARIVNELRHSLTAVGVLRWFDRPRQELGEKPPRALLDDVESIPRLLRLAASIRHSDAA